MKALYLDLWVCTIQSLWQPLWPGPGSAPASRWWSSAGRWRRRSGSSSAQTLALEWSTMGLTAVNKTFLTLTGIAVLTLYWQTDTKPGRLGESHLVMSWQADDVGWARIKIAWQKVRYNSYYKLINKYQVNMSSPHLNSPTRLSCWDSLVLWQHSDFLYSGGCHSISWWHILAYANH